MKFEQKSLFTLANKDKEDAIYLIPTAGTTAISLIPLSRLIDPSLKVCSFTHQGMETDSEPLQDIEETATAYIKELLETQPEGPYIFIGFCYGGVIAYEITRQLKAINKTVSKLVVIDTFPPLLQGETRDEERIRKEVSFGDKVLQDADKRFSTLPKDNTERIFKVMQAQLDASYKYRTNMITANITLLQSPVYDDSWYQDWKKRSIGSFQKIHINEDPLKLLYGEKATSLAEAVNEAIHS